MEACQEGESEEDQNTEEDLWSVARELDEDVGKTFASGCIEVRGPADCHEWDQVEDTCTSIGEDPSSNTRLVSTHVGEDAPDLPSHDLVLVL